MTNNVSASEMDIQSAGTLEVIDPDTLRGFQYRLDPYAGTGLNEDEILTSFHIRQVDTETPKASMVISIPRYDAFRSPRVEVDVPLLPNALSESLDGFRLPHFDAKVMLPSGPGVGMGVQQVDFGMSKDFHQIVIKYKGQDVPADLADVDSGVLVSGVDEDFRKLVEKVYKTPRTIRLLVSDGLPLPVWRKLMAPFKAPGLNAFLAAIMG